MTAQVSTALSISAAICDLLVPTPAAPTQEQTAPTRDVAVDLAHQIGRLGTMQSWMGGFRIKTEKPLAFPFGRVLSELATRGFKVTVSQSGSVMVIDARP